MRRFKPGDKVRYNRSLLDRHPEGLADKRYVVLKQVDDRVIYTNDKGWDHEYDLELDVPVSSLQYAIQDYIEREMI